MIQQTSHARFWLIAFAIFAGLLWLLKPVLLPFVAGLVIAYFLNPAVNVLAKRKIPRWLGSFLVLTGFILFAVLLLLLLFPLVQSQLSALISALPGYIAILREQVIPWAESWAEKLSPEDVNRLQEAASQFAGSAAEWAGNAFKKILSEGAALFNMIALAIVTPVVAFFVLRDWTKLTIAIDRMIPRRYYELIKAELAEIDRALSGFIRGQALVCLTLGIIYSVGLKLAGLQYGITVGIIAGVLSFVPYVGSSFMLIASLLLAFVQFDNFMDIGKVLLVYVIGQVLEGYVLTPKLVGDRVGLHPVWIIFAIFVGGSLLGFLGVVIAVPVAAIIGVLVRFALRLYRMSSLYHGEQKTNNNSPFKKK